MLIEFSKGWKNMNIGNKYSFNKNDNKAVDLLVNLGMNENIAKTLIYVSQVEECRSSEIEDGAGLRQPEVSIATMELRKKGWIDKKELKKQGKGRPVHLYKVNTDIGDIVKELESEKSGEIKRTIDNLSELRSLIEEK
jgi:predicted transcriptional regulator